MTDKLQSIHLLQPLDLAARQAVAGRAQFLSFAQGDAILSQHRDDQEVYFVLEGTVRIVNYSETGREVAYAVLAPGSYFGELAAIDHQPRSASAVALTDCELASLSDSDFRALLLNHSEIAMQIVENLVGIIRTCDDRIMDLATLSAHQRVYRELLNLARPDPVQPGSWLVHPVPTQIKIAGQAATTRETVARAMSVLLRTGVLAKKDKTLYLRDRERLEAMAALGDKATADSGDGGSA